MGSSVVGAFHRLELTKVQLRRLIYRKDSLPEECREKKCSEVKDKVEMRVSHEWTRKKVGWILQRFE